MLSDLLHISETIVKDVGVELKNFQYTNIVGIKKNDEIVTEGDQLVDRKIRRLLKEKFPNHGFYSEESGGNQEEDFVWILDPIDGTTFYKKEIPLYTVSLALQKQGKLVLGIVYNPELDYLYSAGTGLGAHLNGHTIRCSSETQLEKCMIYAEIPSRHSSPEIRRWALEKMNDLIVNTGRMRIFGVGALGLCFCASGGFDAYVNLGSGQEKYDYAAGKVIVKESGCTFTEFGPYKIAGPPKIHDALLDLLDLQSSP